MARSKYHAKLTLVDGLQFASGMEARRYVELRTLLRTGAIRDLQLQPRYPLRVNGVNCGTYVADFYYVDAVTGLPVTEDVKGFVTATYKLKKKLVKALYGIDILETQAKVAEHADGRADTWTPMPEVR